MSIPQHQHQQQPLRQPPRPDFWFQDVAGKHRVFYGAAHQVIVRCSICSCDFHLPAADEVASPRSQRYCSLECLNFERNNLQATASAKRNLRGGKRPRTGELRALGAGCRKSA